MFFILPILSCPPTPPLFVRARVDVLSPKNKSVLNGIIRSYTRYNRNVLKDMKGDGMRNSTNIQLTTKWILWVGYFFFGKINCVPWYFIPFCIPISLDWLCARVVGVCVCVVCAPFRCYQFDFKNVFRVIANVFDFWIKFQWHYIGFSEFYFYSNYFYSKCFMNISAHNPELQLCKRHLLQFSNATCMCISHFAFRILTFALLHNVNLYS